MRTNGVISTVVLGLLLGAAVPVSARQEQRDEKNGHGEAPAGKHEQAKPSPQHDQQQRQSGQRQQQQPAQHQSQNRQPSRDQQPQHQSEKRQPDRSQQQQQHQTETRQQDRGQQQQRQTEARQQQRQSENRQQNRAATQQRQEAHQQNAHQQEQRADRRGNDSQGRTEEQHRVQQSAWQQHRSQHWDSDHRSWQQRGGYRGYRIPDDRFRGYFGPEHGFRISGLPFMVVSGYPRFQYGGYWITAVDPWPEYWGDNWYDNDDVYVGYADNGYYLYNRRYPTAGIAIRISM